MRGSMITFPDFVKTTAAVCKTLSILETVSYAVLIHTMGMNYLQAQLVLEKLERSGLVSITPTRMGQQVAATERGRACAAAAELAR